MYGSFSYGSVAYGGRLDSVLTPTTLPAERIYQSMEDGLKRARGMFSNKTTGGKKKTNQYDSSEDGFNKKLF